MIDKQATDEEKLADYTRVMEIMRDAVKLEQHYVDHGEKWETIEFVRADAYKRIADVLLGFHSLPGM